MKFQRQGRTLNNDYEELSIYEVWLPNTPVLLGVYAMGSRIHVT